MGCAQSTDERFEIKEADKKKSANIELKNSVIYIKNIKDFIEIVTRKPNLKNIKSKVKKKLFFLLKKVFRISPYSRRTKPYYVQKRG